MPYGTAGSIAHQVAHDLELVGLDDTAATWAPAKDVCAVDATTDDLDEATTRSLHVLLGGTWNGDLVDEAPLSWRIRAPHPGRQSPVPTGAPCAVCSTRDRPRFQAGHGGDPLCIIHHDIRRATEVVPP